MKLDSRFSRWPILALVLLSAVALMACTEVETTDPEASPTETPLETVTAPMQSEDIPTSDFVNRHAAISEEWNSFHSDFDQWSASLSSCHPNAMHLALNDFAVSFNTVTRQARDLTRGSTSSELADLLITAAQEEEMAFRQLRDHWQPGNVSLFEDVEQARAESALAQKSAEDRAIEILRGFEDAADPEAVAEFQTALDPIKTDWETLHDDYATLQEDSDDLGAAGVLKGIEAHLEGLESIADAINELPELEEAEDTVEDLKDALADEIKAFKAAIKSARPAETKTEDSEEDEEDEESEEDEEDEDSEEDEEDEDSEEDEEDEDSEEDEEEEDEGPKLPDFKKLDSSIEASGKSLKEAGRTIDGLADPDAERSRDEIALFGTEYRSVVGAWDDFHDRYNIWRKDDGGCDRADTLADLEQYSLRISQLARDVRSLPSSGYLLPIYNLLMEAAARDENAVRTLRYTWQPFTLDSFKAVHQERTNTDNLRREAEIAVQELRRRS